MNSGIVLYIPTCCGYFLSAVICFADYQHSSLRDNLPYALMPKFDVSAKHAYYLDQGSATFFLSGPKFIIRKGWRAKIRYPEKMAGQKINENLGFL